MKSMISIGVAVAALISTAALASAQTATPYTQRGAHHGWRTNNEWQRRHAQAIETWRLRHAGRAQGAASKAQGAASQGAAQGRSQTGQDEEHSRNVTHQGSDATGQGQEQNPNAKQQVNADQRGAQTGQTLEQNRNDRATGQAAQQPGTLQQGQAALVQPGAEGTQQPTTQGEARTAQSQEMSRDQQAKIRDSLASNDSARVDHADFGLNLGARVPANERLQPLPPEAEAIDPRLTGNKFLIVENEIVIVDPRTYSVVALIPEASGPEQSGGAQPKAMSEDQTGQTQEQNRNDRATGQAAQQPGTLQQGQATLVQPGAEGTQQPTTQGEARTAQSQEMSRDQQAKIRYSLASNDSARVDHADFGLNVGASVPANERLQPLPPQAEAIDPRLTGDKFLIVENEIVIVDPRTYSVVALIPEASGPEQSGAAQANEMSEDQQDQIRQSVANNSSACLDHADFALNVGAAVPRNEPLEPLPPEAVADNPQFSGDSFLVVEDRIVIVDPRTYRIAALIPEAGGPGEGGSVCAQL